MCGDSVFKAARSDAGKYRKLDETGIMMRSCRHGIVDKAVNMHQGETFRHTHFMHKDLPEKNCKFLCNDVICHYWDFAKKVGQLFPQFASMTDLMNPFLSRMHLKLHVWYCQVRLKIKLIFWDIYFFIYLKKIVWSGHWMEGAALTVGEEQEQTFSKMSKYGTVTKHMGKSSRQFYDNVF